MLATSTRPTADSYARRVDFDSHAEWARFVSHTAITLAMKRVFVWPAVRDDGSMSLTTKIRYSSSVEDGAWTDDVEARGILTDGADDLRAIVYVYANGIRVDSFFTNLGSHDRRAVRPIDASPEIWWHHDD